jgi:hypothetical protein
MKLSRRDFLKLSGCGMMGMVLPGLPFEPAREDEFDNLQGRVIDRTIWMYDAPNPKARRLRLFWRDLVIPIKNTTISDDESVHNRIWYQVEEGGYVYSGSIQPPERTAAHLPQGRIGGGQCPVHGSAPGSRPGCGSGLSSIL